VAEIVVTPNNSWPARALVAPSPDYPSPYPDGSRCHRSSETECAAPVVTLEGAAEKRRPAYALVKARGECSAAGIEGQDDCFYSFPKRWCDLKHDGFAVDKGKKRLAPFGVMATVKTLTHDLAHDWAICRECEGCGCRCAKGEK